MASVGIAVFPEHGASSEALLQRAEVAMYAAKRSGNLYSVYREQDDPYDPSRLVLRADFRRAIEQRGRAFFQPQVAIATGEVISVEASSVESIHLLMRTLSTGIVMFGVFVASTARDLAEEVFKGRHESPRRRERGGTVTYTVEAAPIAGERPFVSVL
jgi:predicted signal transduction protein with EAL and GGDEF domain